MGTTDMDYGMNIAGGRHERWLPEPLATRQERPLSTRASFVVPEQVVEEITVPQQIQTLNAAIRGGQLRSERSTTPDELASYANSASSWDGAKPLASPWRSNVAGSLRSTSAAVSSG